jgi:hypothetical protein
MNDITLAGTMATAPSAAFAELRERPRFWFPLLLLTVSSAGIVYWYFSVVDIEWLKIELYGHNPAIQALSEADRAKAMASISRDTLLWSSMVGTIVALPFFLLLQALYMLVAAKVTKLPFGFKHWFALICWSALPALLSAVIAAIFMMISDTAQISPSVMQPMSLNEFAQERPGTPGYAFLQSLNIPSALCWILMIIGVRTWSQRSWAFSTTMILLLIVLFYGTWFAYATW